MGALRYTRRKYFGSGFNIFNLDGKVARIQVALQPFTAPSVGDVLELCKKDSMVHTVEGLLEVQKAAHIITTAVHTFCYLVGKQNWLICSRFVRGVGELLWSYVVGCGKMLR